MMKTLPSFARLGGREPALSLPKGRPPLHGTWAERASAGRARISGLGGRRVRARRRPATVPSLPTRRGRSAGWSQDDLSPRRCGLRLQHPARLRPDHIRFRWGTRPDVQRGGGGRRVRSQRGRLAEGVGAQIILDCRGQIQTARVTRAPNAKVAVVVEKDSFTEPQEQ